MKPVLEHRKEKMRMSGPGKEAAFPAIMSGLNIQNKSMYELEEEDEIYEGFGMLGSVYPYRPYNTYHRELSEREIDRITLENDYLKAEFLPTLGGRLWRLTDKKTGQNLLYTNDCIRPSNLAVRNAWFSGGVEWNVGIIGHTPLTMEPLFTARLADEEGNPVLRMYEYERIRKVVYQMDFWLEEKNAFLNCRMRIVNESAEVIPMYWWSNMAVPQYPEGRILCPAKEAFTSDRTRVYKVSIPYVEGVDVTRYNDIPDQVDYFFHIPDNEKKYIAHLNKDGYGLLHISTDRLRSRKLFVWGHNDAADRWQEFLTENAGPYIEIQAGIGKTQYGCIPMAPHTAWEWVEQYGAVQMDVTAIDGDFESAQMSMQRKVTDIFAKQNPDTVLRRTKKMAKTKGTLLMKGSGYGALENMCRSRRGESPLSGHLDFDSEDMRQEEWKAFLVSGTLNCPDPAMYPSDFTRDDYWFDLLKKAVQGPDAENWYAHYQLALQYMNRGEQQQAKEAFRISRELTDNVWADHGMAVCLMAEGKSREASALAGKILACPSADLSMVKECFDILLKAKTYDRLLEEYDRLPEAFRKESRICFDYIQALAGNGEYEKARTLLVQNGGLEIADIREGDNTLDELWKKLKGELKIETKIPHKLNFCAMAE